MINEGNRGLSLALPITLGLILLALIVIILILIYLARGRLFDKKNRRNKSYDKGIRNNWGQKKINNYSNKNNNSNNSSKHLLFFPSKGHPSKTSCGFFQPGDVHYEEHSRYQAGKWGREAVDLISDWSKSCHVRDTPDGEPANEDELSAQDIRPLHAVQKMNPNLDLHKVEWKAAEMEKRNKKRITSVDNIKQMSLVDANTYTLKKVDKRKTFVAMYPLTSSSKDELNILANDVIFYLGEKKNGWLKGEKKDTGDVGWFPRSYVREGMSQAPDTSMFVSTNDFDDEDANNHNDDENYNDDDEEDDDEDAILFECVVRHDYNAVHVGDMNLKKGDVVLVHETMDNGWWRGECGGGKGFFPGSYVQISENRDLVTRSCMTLSDVNDQEKRGSLGRQFIQKLSAFNIGTTKKGKKKKKIRQESVKVMNRKPAPSPGRDLNSSFKKEISYVEIGVRQNHVTTPFARGSQISLNVDADTIYGNLEPFSASTLPTKSSTTNQRPQPTIQQNIYDVVQSSLASSSHDQHKTALGNNPTNNILQLLRADKRSSDASTSPLRSSVVGSNNNSGYNINDIYGINNINGGNNDNFCSRLSLDFNEELKIRVNSRLKN